MEVSGQTHFPVALAPVKEPLIVIAQFLFRWIQISLYTTGMIQHWTVRQRELESVGSV
jgi:hypothetical protein